MLAKNFAMQLQTSFNNLCKEEFGECFVYNEAMLGKIMSDGTYIMIEQYINKGNFSKYVNSKNVFPR